MSGPVLIFHGLSHDYFSWDIPYGLTFCMGYPMPTVHVISHIGIPCQICMGWDIPYKLSHINYAWDGIPYGLSHANFA